MEKRILFIATANIFIRSGGSLANLAYYNALRCIFPGGVDLAMPAEALESYKGDLTIIPIRNRSKIKRLFGLLTGDIHRYKDFVNDIFATQHYDICVINGGQNAGDIIDICHKKNTKVIVMHHNFEREYQKTDFSNPLFRIPYLYYVKRNEKRAYLKSDVNCFISKADATLFAVAYGSTESKNYCIGIFEPDSRDFSSSSPIVQQNTYVISGSFNARQTIEGIDDFFLHYVKHLYATDNNACLTFTGRNADIVLRRYDYIKNYNTKVIANPDNIENVVSQSQIYLCPINVGGGLKLRLMDGLKLGLPVLTHEVSARGFDYFFNKPYFKIYKDEETFKNGLMSLIDYVNSGHDRKKIRQDYFSQFSFESGVSRFTRILKDAGLF